MDKQSLVRHQVGSLTGLNAAELRDVIGMFVANDNAALIRAELGEILQSILQTAVDGGGGGGGNIETDTSLTGTGTELSPLSINTDGVTTAKITDLAVTTGKINNLAVTEGKINTGAVTSGKIGNGAVGTTKIADDAVTNIKLATDAVTNVKIANGTIGFSKFGVNSAVEGDVIKYTDGAWSAEPDGGGGGGGVVAYTTGSGAYVLATGAGISSSRAVAGTCVFYIPDGVMLLSANVVVLSGDIVGNEFTVTFDGNYAAVDGVPRVNTNVNNLFPPTVMKYNRALNGNPTTDIPYVIDIDNTPQMQITSIVPLSIRIINVTDNWGLKFNF